MKLLLFISLLLSILLNCVQYVGLSERPVYYNEITLAQGRSGVGIDKVAELNTILKDKDDMLSFVVPVENGWEIVVIPTKNKSITEIDRNIHGIQREIVEAISAD